MWTEIATIISLIYHTNTKARILQKNISEFGPVPDELGDLVRNALKNQYETM